MHNWQYLRRNEDFDCSLDNNPLATSTLSSDVKELSKRQQKHVHVLISVLHHVLFVSPMCLRILCLRILCENWQAQTRFLVIVS
jgi:hypothetical protein